MVAVLAEKPTYRNAAEVLALVRDFRFRTLPREQWTHRAHLTVALWHLLRYPWTEAVERMRYGIKRYNRAHGIITTPESGYHETITLFWMKMVRQYLSNLKMPKCTLSALANGLVQFYGDKDLPLKYYSRERLMSVEARAVWVEPDLRPLK